MNNQHATLVIGKKDVPFLLPYFAFMNKILFTIRIFPLCHGFFFQFCDVAKLAIIHKMI